MIPVWIIDELTRQEEQRRQEEERRRERLELPLTPRQRPEPREEAPHASGTVVIELWPD
jgi:hypothetical protein